MGFENLECQHNEVMIHGAIKPYGGTFLTFLDYARNAVRMSALMKLPVIYVYTHDSIGVGERSNSPTGRTHYYVESYAWSFTWRPCDR